MAWRALVATFVAVAGLACFAAAPARADDDTVTFDDLPAGATEITGQYHERGIDFGLVPQGRGWVLGVAS